MAPISSYFRRNIKDKRNFFNLGVFHRLTAAVIPRFVSAMQRIQLKSKLHRAIIKQADIDYEGSIEIPSDLMEASGLWEGERVLVTSMTSGSRLETYVQAGDPGTGHIIMNGGAAHLIKKGECVTIMAFGISDERIIPLRHVLNLKNEIIKSTN
ncbi:MAG: aspartate 1-decarboxylase [Akkermansiaceae bacterium]|jgi:aspartate 1-decarboxylase|nr:aspartate 1-decarboxylase [Akkermansiaceae bacterium]